MHLHDSKPHKCTPQTKMTGLVPTMPQVTELLTQEEIRSIDAVTAHGEREVQTQPIASLWHLLWVQMFNMWQGFHPQAKCKFTPTYTSRISWLCSSWSDEVAQVPKWCRHPVLSSGKVPAWEFNQIFRGWVVGGKDDPGSAQDPGSWKQFLRVTGVPLLLTIVNLRSHLDFAPDLKTNNCPEVAMSWWSSYFSTMRETMHHRSSQGGKSAEEGIQRRKLLSLISLRLPAFWRGHS